MLNTPAPPLPGDVIPFDGVPVGDTPYLGMSSPATGGPARGADGGAGSRRGWRVSKAALSVAAAAALLGVVLPWWTGTGWAAIVTVLSEVSPSDVLALGAVWFAGMLTHSVVWISALPGLTIRRALLMSLTGGAVTNVLPMGGAAGTALNYSMCRRWGHSSAAFVLFTVVTHIWGLIAKLALPAIAMAALLLCGDSSTALLIPTLLALAALTALIAGLAAVLTHEGAAVAVGRAGERVVAGVGRILGKPWRVNLEESTRSLRAEGIAMTRRDWRRPAAGMFGALVLQAMLLWLCLEAVGSTVGPVQVFAVFAVERLLGVVVVTPGGVGVVELTMTAMLTTFGGTSATVAAGVLLYRAFTYAVTIPLGGALLLGWMALGRRRPPAAEPALHPAPSPDFRGPQQLLPVIVLAREPVLTPAGTS